MNQLSSQSCENFSHAHARSRSPTDIFSNQLRRRGTWRLDQGQQTRQLLAAYYYYTIVQVQDSLTN